MAAPTLPTELIAYIIRLVAEYLDPLFILERTPCLLKFCLVSHLFRRLALPYIYRRIYVNLETAPVDGSESERRLVIDHSDFPRIRNVYAMNRAHRRLVKDIEFKARLVDGHLLPTEASVAFIFKLLLGNCPNIEIAVSTGLPSAALVRAPWPVALQSLELKDIGVLNATDAEDLVGTLESLVNLTELVLDVREMPTPTSPLRNFPCSLKKLVLKGAAGKLYPRFVESSSNTLRSLYLNASPPSSLSSFVQLQGFELDHPDNDGPTTVDTLTSAIHAFDSCDSLRVAALYHYDLTSPEAVSTFLHWRPSPAILLISLLRGSEVLPEMLLDMAKSSRFNRAYVYWDGRDWEDEQHEEVKKVMDERDKAVTKLHEDLKKA